MRQPNVTGRSLLRDSASVRRETGWVSEVGIESLSLSNAVAWADAWTEVRNHVLLLEDVKDAEKYIRDINQ